MWLEEIQQAVRECGALMLQADRTHTNTKVKGGLYSGVHYSVSKGGVLAMSKCFALSGAPFGITSNAVLPGVVETAMSRAEGIPADDVPLGRAAQPEEVADMIFFLASGQAAYLTGVTLDVNGGQYMA